MDPVSIEAVSEYYEIIRHPNWRDTARPGVMAAVLGEVNPDALAVESQPLDAAAMEKAPTLKLIASVRAKPANIDTEYCSGRGIVVTNAPGRNAMAVVEMTMALILNAARNIPLAYHTLRQGRMVLPAGTPPRENRTDVIWSHPSLDCSPYVVFKGMEIAGKTLGLIGFGTIGKLVASRAKAFEMRVLVFDPYVHKRDLDALGVEPCLFDEILAQSDFVSLHAKVTPETRHFLGWDEFKKMKPTAILVNTARGALVDQDALVRALREKVIAGAALDVFESEPLTDDSPLLAMDTVIVTPHIGGATRDVVVHQSRLVCQNAIAYAMGQTPPNLYIEEK